MTWWGRRMRGIVDEEDGEKKKRKIIVHEALFKKLDYRCYLIGIEIIFIFIFILGQVYTCV